MRYGGANVSSDIWKGPGESPFSRVGRVVLGEPRDLEGAREGPSTLSPPVRRNPEQPGLTSGEGEATEPRAGAEAMGGWTDSQEVQPSQGGGQDLPDSKSKHWWSQLCSFSKKGEMTATSNAWLYSE